MLKAEGNRKKTFHILSLGWQDKMNCNKHQFEQDNLIYWVLKLLQMLNCLGREIREGISLQIKSGWVKSEKRNLLVVSRNWFTHSHILRYLHQPIHRRGTIFTDATHTCKTPYWHPRLQENPPTGLQNHGQTRKKIKDSRGLSPRKSHYTDSRLPEYHMALQLLQIKCFWITFLFQINKHMQTQILTVKI